MNRRRAVSPANAPPPALAELQNLEREARRLRAEHARDPLATLAHRVAARLRAPGRAATSAVR